MPIRKEMKNLYPKNWKEISLRIRFERADNKCGYWSQSKWRRNRLR